MIIESTYWAEDHGPFQHKQHAEAAAVEQGLDPDCVDTRLIRLRCPNCDADPEPLDDAPGIVWCWHCDEGFPRHGAAWEPWDPEAETEDSEEAA